MARWSRLPSFGIETRGRSKGFAFVEMPTNAEAQAAIAAFNGQEYNRRTLTVNEAPAQGGARLWRRWWWWWRLWRRWRWRRLWRRRKWRRRWRWTGRKFSLVAKANHLLTRRRKSIGVHLLTGDRCPGLLSLYREGHEVVAEDGGKAGSPVRRSGRVVKHQPSHSRRTRPLGGSTWNTAGWTRPRMCSLFRCWRPLTTATRAEDFPPILTRRHIWER